VAPSQTSGLDKDVEELLKHERFREMFKYLIENKDELLKAHKLELVFNCAGPNIVKPRRTIY